MLKIEFAAVFAIRLRVSRMTIMKMVIRQSQTAFWVKRKTGIVIMNQPIRKGDDVWLIFAMMMTKY